MGGNQPVNTKILGGVCYNANKFTGKDLGNGKFQLTAKEGGEIIVFGQQPESGYRYSDGTMAESKYASRWNGDKREDPIFFKPEIVMSTNTGNLFVNKNSFTIRDIDGAKFESSTKTVANVKLKNCKNTTVDLANNKSSHFGDSAKIEGGKDNEVILDKKDVATINNKNIEGAGTASQKDY